LSLLFQVSLGSVDGVHGFGPDGFGFSLGGEGGRLLDKEFVEVSLFSFDFTVEEGLFSARVALPFSEGPGGSDFGGLEESEGFVKLVLDGSEDFINLLSDGISLLLGGGQLKEGLLGLFVEEGAVVGQSVGDVVHVDLSEGTTSQVAADILSQESDDFEGIRVVLEGLDEQGIGVASLVGQLS
jgi:hypothetical protein